MGWPFRDFHPGLPVPDQHGLARIIDEEFLPGPPGAIEIAEAAVLIASGDAGPLYSCHSSASVTPFCARYPSAEGDHRKKLAAPKAKRAVAQCGWRCALG